MKKIHLLFLFVFFTAFLFSCKNEESPMSEEVELIEVEAEIDEYTQCFLLVENQDSTFVSLKVEGSAVSGTMDWIPYEKDGARGTLAGTINELGEFDLLYTYVIEGSNQTETIIMKIESDSLYLKEGELEDPNFDGNLVYKDEANAVYGEGIPSVPCQ